MNYWVNTQWPPREEDPVNRLPIGVWVQDEKLAVLDGMDIGDLVFFYEASNGPALVHIDTDGSRRKIKSQKGRKGVIALGRVVKKPFQPSWAHPQHYTDSNTKWWRYFAPVEIINSNGFISKADFLALLGFNPAYTLRGFGDKNSGVKRIKKSVFDNILAKFETPLP